MKMKFKTKKHKYLNILLTSESSMTIGIGIPGVARCFNGMGYLAVGSGMPHSLHSFITNNYNPDWC